MSYCYFSYHLLALLLFIQATCCTTIKQRQQHTIDTNSITRLHVERLKRLILKQLHLKDRPPAVQSASDFIIPELVLDDNGVEEDDNVREEKNEIKFILTPKKSILKTAYHHYIFKLKRKFNEDILLEDTNLFIYVIKNKKHRLSTQTLTITINGREPITHTVTNDATGWHSIDIKDLLSKKDLSRKINIKISCENCADMNFLKPYNKKFAPFINLKFAEKIHRRVERSIDSCKDTVTCCKRKLWVNLTDFGWDGWLVSPYGFNANYCGGKCTPSITESLTNTTTISRTLTAGTTCCTPTKHKRILLTFLLEDGTMYRKHFDNLITDECGCS